ESLEMADQYGIEHLFIFSNQVDIVEGQEWTRRLSSNFTKAEQYAKLANVKLGRVVHVSEGDAPTVPAPFRTMNTMMFKGAADEATPIHAGEEEVSVTVNVAFSIIN
ncbi:MAG: SIMPL domain-containing protein, partial [Gammaproteobacteria bacterium]